MNIYFDGTLIDNDYVFSIEYEGKLFIDNDIFSLGSTICGNVKLNVSKELAIQPTTSVEISNLGVFNIDNVEEDNEIYSYILVDKMINFNFRYDAQPLIEASQHVEQDGTKYVTLLELLQDICTKAGVTLQTNTFLGYNKHISWYDNTVTAREYVGMIAELNGGYAIENNGLYLKQYNNISSENIALTDCFDYNIGESHVITKIAMENSLFEPVGTNEGTTLYINANNVFITEREDLINIYNVLHGIEFYSIEAEMGNILVDNNSIGNCITFSDGTNTYKAFKQVTASFNGGWNGKYNFIIGSNKKEETSIYNGTEDNYKRLKFQVDRDANKIELLAEQAQIISDTVTGLGSITLSNAYEGLLHYLDITGQIDGYYPRNDIYPKNDIYPREPADLVIDDTHYRLDINELNYISPSICDKFIYEEGKCKIYRMVEIINGQKVPLITPYYEDRNDIELMVSENSVISLVGYPTIKFNCQYLMNNIYTEEFANKIETKASIEVTNDRITETVEAVADSENKVTPASIMLAVNNDESTVQITADKINLEGYATFTDLETAGSTTINGSNITTGTIDAREVKVTHINASNITGGTINGHNVNVTNINASNINTGTINGLPLTSCDYQFRGFMGSIRLWETGSSGVMMGWYGDTVSTDSARRYALYSLQAGGRFQTFDSSGTAAYYFSETGSHANSDIRYKKHIKNIEQEKSIDIITNLNPIEYDYDKEQKYRGVSAQDVEMLLNRNGYYNQVYSIEEDGRYTLQYEQLIPDLINCIKYLNNKIIELENKEEK